jgi:hypothetical protein
MPAPVREGCSLVAGLYFCCHYCCNFFRQEGGRRNTLAIAKPALNRFRIFAPILHQFECRRQCLLARVRLGGTKVQIVGNAVPQGVSRTGFSSKMQASLRLIPRKDTIIARDGIFARLNP